MAVYENFKVKKFFYYSVLRIPGWPEYCCEKFYSLEILFAELACSLRSFSCWLSKDLSGFSLAYTTRHFQFFRLTIIEFEILKVKWLIILFLFFKFKSASFFKSYASQQSLSQKKLKSLIFHPWLSCALRVFSICKFNRYKENSWPKVWIGLLWNLPQEPEMSGFVVL